MQLRWARQHALGDRMTAGYHQVVIAEVQLFNGDGHQGQIHPVTAPNERHTLKKRRCAGPGDAYFISVRRRQHIKQTKQVGIRQAPEHGGQHALCPTDRIQPVMHHGNT